MASGADSVLDALLREGIGHLFMVPGGLIDPLLPALAPSSESQALRRGPRRRRRLYGGRFTRAPAAGSAPPSASAVRVFAT